MGRTSSYLKSGDQDVSSQILIICTKMATGNLNSTSPVDIRIEHVACILNGGLSASSTPLQTRYRILKQLMRWRRMPEIIISTLQTHTPISKRKGHNL